MPFDLKMLTSFDPDKEDLWEIRFHDGDTDLSKVPDAFKALIPAADVNMNLWSVTADDHAYGNTTLKHITGTSSFPMSITFYDDEKITLASWFTDWVNKGILHTPGCVLPLSLQHRKVEVRKLNRQRDIVKVWRLLVIPDGEGNFAGNAGSSEVKQTVHAFTIVGTFGEEASVPTAKYNQQEHIDRATGLHNASPENAEQYGSSWSTSISSEIPEAVKPYIGL